MRKKNQYDNQYWYVYVSYNNWTVYKTDPGLDVSAGPFTNIKILKKEILTKIRYERDLVIKELSRAYLLKNEDVK